MTATKLKRILEKHRKWLNGKEGGVRADLSGADLRWVDLSEKCLSCANLSGANLCDANLRGTNLSDANLRGANLSFVNLSGADLGYADLSDANLYHADLSGANLNYADFSGTNLGGADLDHADLSGANLSGADLDYSCLPLLCRSLRARFDDRQIIQILYHAVKAGTESPNVSDELKEVLWGLADTANKFHHVEECGRIERRKDNAELH